MDPKLDFESKMNLIKYLRSKVPGDCSGTMTQDASKSRNGAVHPMFEILLYADLNCIDAAAMLDRIETNKHMDSITKVELVEVIQEATPHCSWDAND